MLTPITTRQLGEKENFFRARSLNKFYRNFVVSGTYSCSLLSDKLLLARALRKLLIDYPSLTCNVFQVEDERRCIMRPVSVIKFSDLVDIYDQIVPITDEGLMRYLAETQFSQIYEEKPLFKLSIPNDSSLSAAFEHTIADGLVGRYFHEIFLENLAYCDKKENMLEYTELYGPTPLDFSDDLILFDLEKDTKLFKNSVPPPLEMYMDPCEKSTPGPLHFSNQKPPQYPELWPGRFPSKLERSIAYKHLNVPAEQLKQILALCKKHAVTLTSYVVVNSALTLLPIFGHRHHILLVTAVTLRRFADENRLEEPYKNLVTRGKGLLGLHSHPGMAQLFAPNESFSWKLVLNYNDNMRKAVSDKPGLWSILDAVKVPNWKGENSEVFSASLGKPKLDSLKLSNLGFVDFPVYKSDSGDWTVKDLVFGQDIAPTSEFVVNVISTPLGGLNIVMSYLNHTFEDSKFGDFDGFSELLRRNLIANIE